ncbi:hypothetical protein B2A_00249, partial [mine drainage metagenome]
MFVANWQSDTVSVISDTNNTVVATVRAGGMPDDVAFDGGNGLVYVANSNQGTVSIILPSASAERAYPVGFTEAGLPSGTNWSVTLGGSTLSSTTPMITFKEPNGSYPFSLGSPGYRPAPESGTLMVNGAPVGQSVTFTRVTYTVTFSESSLPSGLTWSVTVNRVPKSRATDGGTDRLTWAGLANGTYNYSIADIPGWHQGTRFLHRPGAGQRNRRQRTEAGLRAGHVHGDVHGVGTPGRGQTWSVTLNGVPQSV